MYNKNRRKKIKIKINLKKPYLCVTLLPSFFFARKICYIRNFILNLKLDIISSDLYKKINIKVKENELKIKKHKTKKKIKKKKN